VSHRLAGDRGGTSDRGSDLLAPRDGQGERTVEHVPGAERVDHGGGGDGDRESSGRRSHLHGAGAVGAHRDPGPRRQQPGEDVSLPGRGEVRGHGGDVDVGEQSFGARLPRAPVEHHGDAGAARLRRQCDGGIHQVAVDQQGGGVLRQVCR